MAKQANLFEEMYVELERSPEAKARLKERKAIVPAWPTLPEYQLTYKSTNTQPLHKILDSRTVYEFAKEIYAADPMGMDYVESFYVIALNRAHKITGVESAKYTGFLKASQGGFTGTVADPRVILTFALMAGAVSLILLHNHPSGNLKPSRADEEMTANIKEAARYLDIKVIDHMIVSSEGYFSFADEGIL